MRHDDPSHIVFRTFVIKLLSRFRACEVNVCIVTARAYCRTSSISISSQIPQMLLPLCWMCWCLTFRYVSAEWFFEPYCEYFPIMFSSFCILVTAIHYTAHCLEVEKFQFTLRFVVKWVLQDLCVFVMVIVRCFANFCSYWLMSLFVNSVCTSLLVVRTLPFVRDLVAISFLS